MIKYKLRIRDKLNHIRTPRNMVQAQRNYKLFPADKLFLLFLFKSILLSTQVLSMIRTTRHVMIKMSKPKEYTRSPEITKHTQAAKVLSWENSRISIPLLKVYHLGYHLKTYLTIPHSTHPFNVYIGKTHC